MSNTKKGVPDVTSLLGNIAQKQKNGELGASPIQAVKPVEISAEKNAAINVGGLISTENSVAVFVINTDEELMIARETLRLVS